MPQQNTVARSLHDVGLAAWFGGALMGAVGLNGASSRVEDRRERSAVASAGWGAWAPVNLGAIAAHVVGGLGITKGNAGRLAAQRGAASLNGAKAGLTIAAVVATAYTGLLGRRVGEASIGAGADETTGGVPVEAATTPAVDTPDDVADAQRKLATFQWVVPALTGALLVLNAKAGEQQRPQQFARGVLDRLRPGV